MLFRFVTPPVTNTNFVAISSPLPPSSWAGRPVTPERAWRSLSHAAAEREARLATGPDPQDDEGTAERLNGLERFAEHDRRDHDREERNEKLEACDARGTNDRHRAEIEDVGKAARTEGGEEHAEYRHGGRDR